MKGYTDEQIREILEQDAKRKERQKKATRRQLARTKLYIQKAKEAGIEVTEDEIEAEIARR